MSALFALSLSVGILGGIWALIALWPIAGYALVWTGFIAAGCFFAAGGDTKALSKTIVGMIYGAIIAWIALLIIAKVAVPLPGCDLAGDRRRRIGVLSADLRVRRIALFCPGQCLWLRRPRRLYAGGQTFRRTNCRGRCQPARYQRHLDRPRWRARLSYRPIRGHLKTREGLIQLGCCETRLHRFLW